MQIVTLRNATAEWVKPLLPARREVFAAFKNGFFCRNPAISDMW